MATEPEKTSGTEQTLTVPMRRHILHTGRGVAEVLDDIYSGISRPDISALFAQLADAATYQDFHDLVRRAQGPAGLMLFMQLDLDTALNLDPQATAAHGRRLIRVIAGNPVTMGQMTRHVADAGSYAPVTILVAETEGGGTRVCYDTVASALAPYSDTQASQVAEHLDVEVLTLLRQATGTPSPNAASAS